MIAELLVKFTVSIVRDDDDGGDDDDDVKRHTTAQHRTSIYVPEASIRIIFIMSS